VRMGVYIFIYMTTETVKTGLESGLDCRSGAMPREYGTDKTAKATFGLGFQVQVLEYCELSPVCSKGEKSTGGAYRGTLHIRNSAPLGPYGSPMRRDPW